MAEVADCRNAFVYFAKCPRCDKVFASFSKFQLLQNLYQHTRRHKNSVKFADIVIKYKVIDICEG